MKRYFITSDIHGFYLQFKKALDDKKFDINNENHILIILGDIFDRGSEALDLYNFIQSIPKDRRILVRGNHEQLYLDLLKKKFPEGHDFHNGTVDTFCQIAKMAEISEGISTSDYLESGYHYFCGTYYDTEKIEPECQEYWNEILAKVKKSKITAWIKSKEWVNYFELKDYIFVHSFIPLNDTRPWLPAHYISGHDYSYREDWRNATKWEWKDATWGCPWRLAKEKLNKTGKYIVCGHWHTSDFYNNLKKVKTYYSRENNPIFKSNRYKLIGIDACTAISNKVNILIVEE